MPIDTALPAADRWPTAQSGWQPKELGLGRATIVSGLVVAACAVGLVWLAAGVAVPPPPPVAVRLVEPSASAAMPASTMAETAPPPLAAPPPLDPTFRDPPPDLVPPSMPPSSLPDAPSDLAVIATPDPVPLLMPAPKRPAPAVSQPIRHERRVPIAHRAPRAETAAPPDALDPVMAQATLPAPVAPAPRPISAVPPDTVSGLGAYQSALHRQIERNMQADRAVAGLGVGGTTVIVASIAPEGRLIDAHIARSSGNRAIDQAALGAVQRGGFAAFGLHMPGAPITISVPISVEAD